MEFDTIAYDRQPDGSFLKTVTPPVRRIVSAGVDREVSALEAQVDDLSKGTSDNPEDQQAIDALIANYRAQIDVLKGRV